MVQGPDDELDDAHAQTVDDTDPSRSDTDAVSAVPTCGLPASVTDPASSTLVTVTATSLVSLRPPSEAFTVTEYDNLVS